MQCSICKKKISTNDSTKIKGGHICLSCLSAFPDSVRMGIDNFSPHQLQQLNKIVHPAMSKGIACGSFIASRNSIVLKNIEYNLSDLRSVKLNFHPKNDGNHPKTAVGVITAIIETKKPHFMIEEPFFPEDVTVGYSIFGKNIKYHYSYEIELLFKKIQECIDDKSYNMSSYIEEYKQAIMNAKKYNESKEQERIRAEEMARKKKAEQEQAEKERKKKIEEEQARKRRQNGNFSHSDSKRQLSPFDKAKNLFGVEIPYTANDIKAARNKLLKEHHPDNNGGSEEMCKKINEYYALLLKYVAD